MTEHETQIDDKIAPVAAEDKKGAPPLNARQEWAEFLKTSAWAIFFALLIRTFMLEPFNIPSGSMKPTLLVGDYLFVSKPAYGFSKHSFPFSFAPIEGRILTRSKMPKRGDVIVFKLPTDTSIDYIKRIVGMPGDTVQMINGALFLNHKKVPRKYLGLEEVDGSILPKKMMVFEEILPNGVKHLIYEDSNEGALDNTEEFTVPSGHYFVMGDNRDNSQDSRVQHLVGFVPLENIVGKASFLFYSTNGYASLFEIWKWPKTVRYDRLFNSISPSDKDT